MKIVAHKEQYRVTLPKELVQDKGWKAGTTLRFVEDEHGRVYLKEVAPDKKRTNSQNQRGGLQR